jgi:hypothetical protein
VVRNENGTVSATVTDSMSGAAAASVSTTVTSNRVGTFNATLTGHDLAGNAASVQCPYVVVSEVQVGSFYGALAAPGFRFRGGLTVPVRFDLRDPSGVVLSDAASQALAAAGSVVVALDSGPAQLAQYRAAEYRPIPRIWLSGLLSLVCCAVACRKATWLISCAMTPAISPSFFAASIMPRLTYIGPPGNEKALISLAFTSSNR